MIPDRSPALQVALLLAGVGFSAAGLRAQEPPRAPGDPPALEAIEGQVRDEGGVPVEEAWVEALAADGRVVRRTVADSVGSFRLVLPAPGTWRLRVSRRDFLARVTDPMEVAGGRTLQVQVTLSPRPVPRTPENS